MTQMNKILISQNMIGKTSLFYEHKKHTRIIQSQDRKQNYLNILRKLDKMKRVELFCLFCFVGLVPKKRHLYNPTYSLELS